MESVRSPRSLASTVPSGIEAGDICERIHAAGPSFRSASRSSDDGPQASRFKTWRACFSGVHAVGGTTREGTVFFESEEAGEDAGTGLSEPAQPERATAATSAERASDGRLNLMTVRRRGPS